MAEPALAEAATPEPAIGEHTMAEAEIAEPAMPEPAMAEQPMDEPELFPNLGDESAHAFVEAEPHGFAEAEPHGFAFDIPPDSPDLFAPPQFEDDFAEEAEPENFLAQARRSARAASEKAETEGRGRLSAFRWGKDPSITSEEKAGVRYLLPSLVVVLVVVIAAAALILNQRARHSDGSFTHTATAQGPATALHPQPKSYDARFAAVPQAGSPSGATNFDTQRSEPDSQDNPAREAMASVQQDVRTAPVNPVPQAAKPVNAAPVTDKVIQYADAGNPVALTILGLRNLDGTGGVSVNLTDAMKFLSQAAEKGQAVAQYRLGTMYERGQGVMADPAKAAHWYELSANQGNRKAMHNLAVSYASGANGKKDMAEGARWFAKAAALGLSDSQFNLAVLYERGDGVPQSLLDAYKWYSIAAATGDSESKQRMSFLQTQLSDTDKAAANRSAAIFHAAPLNRAANVPPEAVDLGR